MSGQDGLEVVGNVPSVKVKSVELADGVVHKLPVVGVTAVVGGNNTGKSTLLRQISEKLHEDPESKPPGAVEYPILKNLDLSVEGTCEDLFLWIQKNSVLQKPSVDYPHVKEGYVRPGSLPVTESQIERNWQQIKSGEISLLAPFLVRYAEAGGRTAESFDVSHRDRPDDPPVSFIHHLEDDNVLRKKVDDLFFNIFGQRLTLDNTKARLCFGDSQMIGYHYSGSLRPVGLFDMRVRLCAVRFAGWSMGALWAYAHSAMDACRGRVTMRLSMNPCRQSRSCCEPTGPRAPRPRPADGRGRARGRSLGIPHG